MCNPCEDAQYVQLDIHCDRLAQFVVGQQVVEKITNWRETSESIFDWLRVAASVESVTVNTLAFGEGVMWEKSVFAYEDARSEVLSCLLLGLVRFNLVWGAFETLAEVIDPPKVPKEIKTRSSRIDEVAYFLKSTFDHKDVPTVGYDCLLHDLQEILRCTGKFDVSRRIQDTACAGQSGMAISVIRHIRNGFAHGMVDLPLPIRKDDDVETNVQSEVDWIGGEPCESRIISLSTRLVLLTMQMMLLTRVASPYWDKHEIPDVSRVNLWDQLDWQLLAILHVRPLG